MKHRTAGLSLGLGLLLFGGALPASGQMWYFPDYAVPSAAGAPATFIAASYGRGLNDDSGKLDAYGAVIGRTGETVSVLGGVGLVSGFADDEVTFGGAVGVDVVEGESATVALQGGIGWMSPGDVTVLRFPIGIAIKGMVETPEAQILPWAMPRVNIGRASAGGSSETTTDLGASAGVTFNFPGGFGVHTALDVLFGDGRKPFTFGIGGHYVLGAQQN